MVRSINSYKIAGNAFTSTKQMVLSVYDIREFVDEVRKKTNGHTKSFVGGFDVTNFVANYDFLFKKSKDTKCVCVRESMRDKSVLDGFFREDLPKEMKKIVDKVGSEMISKMGDRDYKRKTLTKSKKVK